MPTVTIFYIQGRNDTQIKVRGHRVDMSEIEKAVQNIPSVDRVAILTFKPNEPMQKVLCYFTVAKNQSSNGKVIKENGNILTELSLKENLKTVLPEYMMPNFIFKLTALPLLVNGKYNTKTDK